MLYNTGICPLFFWDTKHSSWRFLILPNLMEKTHWIP